MSFRVSLGFFLMVSLFSYNNMHTSSYTLRLLFLCSLHEIYIYAMYYMKCYLQTTILKPNKRQEPSEVNVKNQSQVKPKPKAKSQKKTSGHANGRF